MDMDEIARNINLLGRFCGKRDVKRLTQEELFLTYGIHQADVMAFFGGSILCGGDILAQAIKEKVARKYVIVGGEGHTTETMRRKMHAEFPMIETTGLPEAEVFAAYLKHRYGLEADFLECKSTNCGNNITYLLELLKEHGIAFESIILTQDATMQHRMEATIKKYVSPQVQIINFAAYEAEVAAHEGKLVYTEEIWGMWDMERYLSLLMGEISRLTDDSEGYGPCGSGYIAHVEIPEQVRSAFEELKLYDASSIRKANPLYASSMKPQELR